MNLLTCTPTQAHEYLTAKIWDLVIKPVENDENDTLLGALSDILSDMVADFSMVYDLEEAETMQELKNSWYGKPLEDGVDIDDGNDYSAYTGFIETVNDIPDNLKAWRDDLTMIINDIKNDGLADDVRAYRYHFNQVY